MSGNPVRTRKVIGLGFSGATLTPYNERPAGTGTLGQSVSGPGELLRDLELQLGLTTPVSSDAIRVTRWMTRMRKIAAEHFYTRSFELDPLGTAQAMLSLRDAMVEAGWNGQAVEDGGPRVDAVVAIENVPQPELPLGTADRVARVARKLSGYPLRVYDELVLAEERRLWPRVWQSVIDSLEKMGARVSRLADKQLPGASAETDLGRLQAALRSGSQGIKTSFQGDGSLVLLHAETSIEAGRLAAAALASANPETTVVIREGCAEDLEYGLQLQRLPGQGLGSSSAWRAMLQVLPLALELAFEPKDPGRVLELLTLPSGPFQGAVGRTMSRALQRAPGVGGKAWEEKKARLPEPREAALGQLAEWFEQPGAARTTGASKEELSEVVGRVREWLRSRVPHTPEDATLLAAVKQCEDLSAALAEDGRTHFDLVAVRRLLGLVAVGVHLEIALESAGRLDYVSAPSALRVPRETVLWWSFVHEHSSSLLAPFRPAERETLERAGLSFPDPREQLRERAYRARCAALAATRRLILVIPRHRAGLGLAPHPLWDEIVARMGLDTESRTRVSFEMEDLLGRHGGAPLDVKVEAFAPLPLPSGHTVWSVPVARGPDWSRHSPASLSTLFGCPLRFGFEHWAGFDSEGSGLPPLYLLSGILGHRLIEELHERLAFDGSKEQLNALAEEQTERLIEREGALLLRPGKAHEREQIHRQLVDAACTLGEVLRSNGLRIQAVEGTFDVPWQGSTLSGRLDLLAIDARNRRVIIDVKWGKSDYQRSLSEGTALQLAAYQHALREGPEVRSSAQPSDTVAAADSSDVTAGYFSLKARRLLVLRETELSNADPVKGPSLDETWRRVERTLPLVQEHVDRGRLAVTGVRGSLPLLELLNVDQSEYEQHYSVPLEAGCKYCVFDALCGRRWEQMS